MAAAFKLRTFLGGALERYRAGGDASSVLLAASQRERAAVGVGRAFLDACAYVLQSEKGLFPSVPLNERFAFLLWLTEILLPASHRWQMGVLQAAARAAAQSGHGWFALQLARMELRLAREHRSAVEDRAMLYVRLAFAADWKGVGIWVGLASGLAAVAALMLARWVMRGRLGLTQRGNA